MSFLVEYDHLYAPVLAKRAPTFRSVFQRLLEIKPRNITVVETGMINDPGNWSGHGQSTILFDALTKSVGGRVFSVDKNPEAVIKTRELVSYRPVLALGDSVNFLHSFNQPIDLLYLDSFDLEHTNPAPATLHQMCEFTAAAKNLHPGSIVLVDDTWWHEGEMPFGKGMVLCEYMKKIPCERIPPTEGMQVAWVLT